jgi:hypothetical protein
VKFSLIVTAEVLKSLKDTNQFAEFLIDPEIKKRFQSIDTVLLICYYFDKQFDLLW